MLRAVQTASGEPNEGPPAEDAARNTGIALKLRENIAMLSREQLTEVKREALDALRGYSTDRG